MTNPHKTTEIAVRKAIGRITGPFYAVQLYDMTGCSDNSVRRVISRLLDARELVRVRKDGWSIVYDKTSTFQAAIEESGQGMNDQAATRLEAAMTAWRCA